MNARDIARRADRAFGTWAYRRGIVLGTGRVVMSTAVFPGSYLIGAEHGTDWEQVEATSERMIFRRRGQLIEVFAV